MKTTYTPAPWKWATPDPKGSASEPVELIGSNMTLAGVQIRTLVNGLGQYQDSTRNANARLIAAAPDLLDALKSALGMIGRTLDEEDSDIYQQAKNAIAKAEGR